MKRILLLKLLLITLVACANVRVVSSQNFGVKIVTAKFEEYKGQLRFDDLLLGEHTNGKAYNQAEDKRLRSFTYSAWFKTDEEHPDRYCCQLLGYGYADYYGVAGSFSVNLSWGKFTLEAKAWSTGDLISDLNVTKTNLTCNKNTWYFLTVVADDVNKEIRLYIDGELKATANTGKDNTGKIMNGTALLSETSMFYLNNGTSGGNIGSIYDEVQLWNKVLTPDEIKASKKGYLKAPQGLVGYYTFDTPTAVNVYPNEGYGAVECPATVVSSYVYGFQATNGDYGKKMLTTDAKADGCDQINKTAEKFAVTIEKAGEGTIVLMDTTNKEYASGTEIEKETELHVKAVAATNYSVDSIKVNGVKLDLATPKFKVGEKTTVNVFFGLMKTRIATDDGTLSEGGKYLCNDASNGTEYAKLTDNNGTYYSIPYGSKVKVGVETKNSYLLSAMQVKDSENKPVTLTENSFTVASPAYTVGLSFDRLYALSLEKEGQGTIVLQDAKGTEYPWETLFLKETELQLKAVAEANYSLDSVRVNGVALDLNNLKFKVSGQMEVKVWFGMMKTKIAVDKGDMQGGKYVCIDPKTNQEYEKKGTGANLYYQIAYGSKVKVKTTENTGYALFKIEVKDAAQVAVKLDGDESFTVASSAYTVSLTFDRVYTIVFTTSAGGTLEIKDAKDNSVIGSQVVAGTKIVIEPKADEGYGLESLKINGQAVTLTGEKYNLDVNHDLIIEAVFRVLNGITDTDSGRMVCYDPVSGIISVAQSGCAVSICNVAGKKVVSLTGNQVNVASLPSGIYILKADWGVRSFTFKFFKK